MNNIAALADARTTPTSAINVPDTTVSAREAFGIDSDLQVPAFTPQRARPRSRRRLSLRPRHDVGDPRRLRLQPARDDPGLSRHRQIDPCRAGRRPAQLALHPRQPRQPHQPHRPGRQGRDRAARQQAGHRIPRGPPALGVAAPCRAVLRRIRCRPPRRHVRDPARARGRGQADPARPEPGDPAAPALPPVLDRQHRRASATRPASITARSRSTRARWTAGTSSRR